MRSNATLAVFHSHNGQVLCQANIDRTYAVGGLDLRQPRDPFDTLRRDSGEPLRGEQAREPQCLPVPRFLFALVERKNDKHMIGTHHAAAGENAALRYGMQQLHQS